MRGDYRQSLQLLTARVLLSRADFFCRALQKGKEV